jgi:transcriptional regulator with XRE-family HTH domain
MDNFAGQVVTRRKECRYSQGKLAALSGMTQAALSRIERISNDALTLKTMRRIAAALDCDLKIVLVPKSLELRSPSPLAADQLATSNTTAQNALVARDWLIITDPKTERLKVSVRRRVGQRSPSI